jgi:hypothetical protein
MDAMYVYLIASSGFFLLGWIVLLLVAYALAFRGDAGLTSSSRNQAGGPWPAGSVFGQNAGQNRGKHQS